MLQMERGTRYIISKLGLFRELGIMCEGPKTYNRVTNNALFCFTFIKLNTMGLYMDNDLKPDKIWSLRLHLLPNL